MGAAAPTQASGLGSVERQRQVFATAPCQLNTGQAFPAAAESIRVCCKGSVYISILRRGGWSDRVAVFRPAEAARRNPKASRHVPSTAAAASFFGAVPPLFPS